MANINFLVLGTFLTFITHCIVFSVAQGRPSFGEQCDSENRCDSRKSLTCNDGKCSCIKEAEMIFDKQRGKCVVLSGERCSYTAIEILTDATKEKRWTESLDCVDNASCNGDGYCGCKANYFETSNGLCLAKRLYKENCTQDQECRTDKHLLCENGRCSCNETESVFDRSAGHCVAKVGFSCAKYGRCVVNAQCHYNIGRICECVGQYKKSEQGFCLGNYNTHCDSLSSPCSEDLSCINGRCHCHFPQHQIFASSLGQCVSLLRGPCLEKRNGRKFEYPCGPNAECRNDGDGLPQCICRKGYIESQNRECRLTYGASCNLGETCDPVADLICENGKCACKDLEIYDFTQSECRGLVGAACSVKQADFCVDGAICHSFRDGKQENGVCKCSPQHSVDSHRKCKVVVEVLSGMENLVNATTT